MDFGYLIEGVVEQDPVTDRFVIRMDNDDGTVSMFDVQEALARYNGQEVRMTLATLQTLAMLVTMAEGGNDVVVGRGPV
jgi:hypothetical protein